MATNITTFMRNRAKTGGRMKGTPNKVTVVAQAFAEQLVTDPIYRANLRERLLAGKVHPAVEMMIWHYTFGKPKEQLELSGSVTMRDVKLMSDSDLMAELQAQQAAIARYLSEHRAERTARADVALMLEAHIDGEIVREQ